MAVERGFSESSNVMPLRAGETAALRTPPLNYEAEQALLGAILTNNRVFDRVNEFLRPDHFADPVHGRIYEAAGTLIQRGQIANFLTLRNLFDQDPGLVEAGGSKYLARLENAVVTIINAEDYGHTVHDLFLRRQLIDLGETVVNEAFAFDLDISAVEQIEDAEQKLFLLAETGQTEGGLQPLTGALGCAIAIAEQAFKRDSHVTGVTTGLTDLDRKLGGLHGSDLVILAGRPSMGKTALATNIAFNAAEAYREEVTETGRVEVKEGAKVAFFSLEMSAEQLRHPHPGRAHGHLQRPHPPRRGARGGFPALRAGGAGAVAPALLHRRHARHHRAGAAHPGPAPRRASTASASSSSTTCSSSGPPPAAAATTGCRRCRRSPAA